MIGLIVILILVIAALGGTLFLLGFRLGGGRSRGELTRVRMEGALTRRSVHDLTRQAFVAMAEEAQRHDSNDHPDYQSDQQQPLQ
jgi:hypothetical protein